LPCEKRGDTPEKLNIQQLADGNPSQKALSKEIQVPSATNHPTTTKFAFRTNHPTTKFAIEAMSGL